MRAFRVERARRLFAEQLESRRLLAADYWVTPMSQVHSNFTGDPGTIARFGDSISVDQSFFTPLEFSHQNASGEAATALSWIQGYLPSEAWDWQSPANGTLDSTTSEFPLAVEQNPPLRNIDHWLANLNPEMAVIMWGTNDLVNVTLPSFVVNMREVVSTVKANGTIPILTTVPPRHNFEIEAGNFAQAIRDLAIEQEVPLIDFHQEILTRNPGDTWDGALIWESGPYTETFTVTVSDGQMTFDWLDLGGSGDVVLINSIEIDTDDDPSFTPVRLDFGTPSSPVEAGYARVEETDVYNTGVGYGWLSGTLQSRDRAVGSDLQRDFVFASNSMSFAADVPDGTYDVTVIMGDAIIAPELMQLSIGV